MSIDIKHAPKSRSLNQNYKLLTLLLVLTITLVPHRVHAVDGCSISGKVNVCCQNAGVGPMCAYCSAQCATNTKGNACDTLDASCNTLVDCTNTLTMITSGEPDLDFTSHGTDTVTTYSWRDWYTNSDETNCPTFQCLIRKRGTTEDVTTTWNKYGVKFQTTDYDAVIIHNDEPGTEVPFSRTRFDMLCFTHYDAAAANPEATGEEPDQYMIEHYDGCYYSSSFPAVASPPIQEHVVGVVTAPHTQYYEYTYQASDFITKMKSTCVFSNCWWYQYSTTCSGSKHQKQLTMVDHGNGNDFTSTLLTTSAQSRYVCLKCDVTRRNGGTFQVESGPVQFELRGCDYYTTVTSPTSHTFYVSDVGATNTITLLNSWNDFFATDGGTYAGHCTPTYTQLYYDTNSGNSGQTTPWSCTSDTNTNTYAKMQCDGATMGNMYIYRDVVYSIRFKITITTAGGTQYTSAFTITTVCSTNSTTISNPADLETTQQYQIHTGDYWNAPSSTGYKPNFWFSPHQITQSACPITNYELINSQVDQTAPSLLTMTSASLASTKYVWVDDTVNFTRGTYTFTIKVTASGGSIFYTDFTVNVIYDCIYDNITYIRYIPSAATNSRAGDMIMVGDHPVTMVSGTVGTFGFYNLDVKSLFTNNASTYCPIQEYRIAKVFNYSNGEVFSSASINQRMYFDYIGGQWYFTDINNDYLNIYVMFQAYNGAIWSDANAQQIIEINLQPAPWVDTIPPIFSQALFPIDLTYNRSDFLSRDWNSYQWRDTKLATFNLPSIYEADNLPVTIEFSAGNTRFASYDAESNNVTIDQSLIKPEDVGSNTISFKITDAVGNMKDYTMVINVNLERDQNAKQNDNQVAQTQTSIQEYWDGTCPGYISSISSLGLVKLIFDESVVKDFNKSLFNTSYVKMFIDPYKEREKASSSWYSKDVPKDSLNFNWTIVEFNLPIVTTQLQFEQATAISPEAFSDYLVMNITNMTLFFDFSKLSESQKQSSCNFNSTISKQMDFNGNKGLSDSLKAIKICLILIMILGAIICMLGSWSFWIFISLIRTFQLIVHLPLSRVVIPPNVMLFFEMVRPIAKLDLLEGIFGVDPSDSKDIQKIQFEQVDQMRELGYDQMSAFLNLSTISILLITYIIRVCAYYFLQGYRYLQAKKSMNNEGGQEETKKSNMVQFSFRKSDILKRKGVSCLKAIDRMGQTLFFYEIVRLLLEGYLEFVVASWLNFFAPDPGSATVIFGCIFSAIILLICWVILPSLSVYMLVPKNMKTINEDKMKKRLGALYNEQKQSSAWTLAYNTVFIARRFLFLMIFLPYSGIITLELLALLYLNLCSIIYIGYNWSLNRKLYNYLDFFDEYWIAILSLHLVLFTDWVGDAAIAFGYGWLMIALMIVNLLVKLLIIFFELSHRIRLIWLRYFHRHWMKFVYPLYIKYILPKLQMCKKPVKTVPKHELDVTDGDPNGFSSNYLIIQNLNNAKSKLSRKQRLKQEKAELDRQIAQQNEEESDSSDESSSSQQQSIEQNKQDQVLITEDPQDKPLKQLDQQVQKDSSKQKSLPITSNLAKQFFTNFKKKIRDIKMSRISEELSIDVQRDEFPTFRDTKQIEPTETNDKNDDQMPQDKGIEITQTAKENEKTQTSQMVEQDKDQKSDSMIRSSFSSSKEIEMDENNFYYEFDAALSDKVTGDGEVNLKSPLQSNVKSQKSNASIFRQDTRDGFEKIDHELSVYKSVQSQDKLRYSEQSLQLDKRRSFDKAKTPVILEQPVGTNEDLKIFEASKIDNDEPNDPIDVSNKKDEQKESKKQSSVLKSKDQSNLADQIDGQIKEKDQIKIENNQKDNESSDGQISVGDMPVYYEFDKQEPESD